MIFLFQNDIEGEREKKHVSGSTKRISEFEGKAKFGECAHCVTCPK